MCVSNNFIELQAYEFCEKIRNDSLYKFVGVDYSRSHINGNGLELINTVILQDSDGTVYYVEPNSNGLKFAKREITYKEYKKLQRKETISAISGFVLIIGSFGALMATFVRFFG
ncbi:hypothetical protein [Bacillus sp. PS06]|uniref:hypothetical protein n=1 Tax=Bacillus sp. PS06 TaxID=2764176 RepID=UPI0017822E59|nr:hypothetical protein [Bacillus sp. PS06]MBD8069279.1 hypothetical protein [Bacillus sp. PS06]